MSKLHLKVVSQEKKILERNVDSVTVPTHDGLITILPKHIGLFSKVTTGELVYRSKEKELSAVVTDGFVNVTPEGQVIVMVDSAVLARDISLYKAREAMEAAKKTMAASEDKREQILAEASLKKAMWEMRIAKKSKKQEI